MMSKEIITKAIDSIAGKAFNAVKEVYDNNRESEPRILRKNSSSRLIFPKYSERRKATEKNRVSEQELRQLFIKYLDNYIMENDWNVYYSIETPTDKPFDFKKDKDYEEGGDNGGISARMDLVIHDGGLKRICLIEFKALNPSKKLFEKDILKLKKEECDSKYFIQIIKSCSPRTIKSLKEKLESINHSGINYKCYCLEDGVDITTKIL